MEFLSRVKDYILILRPVNLFIICAAQYFIQYFIIVPDADNVTLSGILFPLFVLDTIIIAGTGYVINDITDQQTDRINKPARMYIGNTITEKAGYIYYILLLLAGAVITVYIAYITNTMKHIWIYPAGICCMYLYSRYLKNTMLIGNIFVSLFIAGVIGILGFAQLIQGNSLNTNLMTVIHAYMAFMFLLNLIREIIKDIEDLEGDLQAGIVTLPGKIGITNTKNLAIIITTLLTVILIWWVSSGNTLKQFTYSVFMLIGLIIPLILLAYKIYNAKVKQDFRNISLWIKLLLVNGLFSVIFIT